MAESKNNKKRCSFCGRSENEVGFLITGMNGYICDSCATQAYEITQEAMGANMLIGVETNPYRIELAKKMGLADYVFAPDEAYDQIMKVTNGNGVERAFDASASDLGRQLAIRATREWGRIAFVGEGGTCTFNPSPDIIHGQKTIYGSWVTSLWRMEELVERLVRWGIHPEDLITDEFPLEQAGEAYRLMASGNCGKVAVVFPED